MTAPKLTNPHVVITLVATAAVQATLVVIAAAILIYCALEWRRLLTNSRRADRCNRKRR